MTIPIISYLNPSGELSNDAPVISEEILLKGYRMMCLTRQMDDRMMILQRQGAITFALSSLGEEACSVASAAALTLEDWMYPQYRESGALFWRGFTALEYVHHMFGDSEDLIFGRQMPNHFGSRKLNVVTVSSPIGTKIPHAAGCAYAMKVLKEKTVSICYFGEGASSEGDFHAGLNFAAVRKAPALFFCRNNAYAISTPCARQFATEESIAMRGAAYGIYTLRADGNDFFAVFDAVSKAKKVCLEGKGPVFIEAMTYRMGAHSSSDDPTLYRSEEEVNCWKEKCPILRLRRYLEKKGVWDQQKEEKLQKEIEKEITDAISVAKGTPRAPLELIVEHVYFETPQTLKEQYHKLTKLLEGS